MREKKIEIYIKKEGTKISKISKFQKVWKVPFYKISIHIYSSSISRTLNIISLGFQNLPILKIYIYILRFDKKK